MLPEVDALLLLEVLDELWAAVAAPDAALLVVLACPGKACAAKIANAPVSATEPAISQRLMRDTSVMARLREVVLP